MPLTFWSLFQVYLFIHAESVLNFFFLQIMDMLLPYVDVVMKYLPERGVIHTLSGVKGHLGVTDLCIYIFDR